MSWDEKRMTFTEHLGELRTRIIRSGICLVACMIVCFIFCNVILKIIAYPLTPLVEHGMIEKAPVAQTAPASAKPGETPAPASTEPAAKEKTPAPVWTVLNPMEPIVIQFKLAFYIGFVLAFPYIIWQVCAFIFPGLRPSERRAVQILIFGCSVLALTGVLVGYLGVLPLVLPYLMSMVPEGWVVQLRATETISIVLMLLAGFAVAFQFPMAVMILVYLGLLTPATLKKQRRMAIVLIAVISAVLTPPDPVSMTIMMCPLILLYEASIWVSYLVIFRRKKAAEAAAEG